MNYIGIGESNEVLNRKFEAAQAAGLTPILCIGETLEERKAAARQYTEQMLRGFLGAMGHEDKAMHDAVVAVALERETVLEDVREKHRAVAQGLMNRETPDEEIQELMIDLQITVVQ